MQVMMVGGHNGSSIRLPPLEGPGQLHDGGLHNIGDDSGCIRIGSSVSHISNTGNMRPVQSSLPLPVIEDSVCSSIFTSTK
jgi:hypothetical protein